MHMHAMELVKKYKEQMQVMQFVTVNDGKPWICSVHYSPADDGSLYWMSQRSTRHSEELRANKIAAAAILIDPDKKQCIHMEGEAFELSGEEAKKAHEIYSKRFGLKEERLEEALSNDMSTRAYYVFKPTSLCLFDLENFPDSPRQECKI